MEDFLDKGWWQTGRANAVIQQHPNIRTFMAELLSEVKPSLIIEIGTSYGGLTVALCEIVEELGLDLIIDSYDPYVRQGLPEVVEQYKFNFLEKGIGSPEIDEEVASKIRNTAGRVLVLCDGANKAYEFNTFSSALKSGDVIGGHDYAEDQADFDNRVKGKLWNWWELAYSHIGSSINDNGLVDLPNDLTQKGKEVVWMLKMKP
jgi:hypothetical protein